MSNYRVNRFFLGIVLPSLLAVGLFIASLHLFFIPSFEKNMMEKKKDMINELTNTALSLVNEYYTDYKNGTVDINEAKNLAAKRIGMLRYGTEKKDYFWITDNQPVMIMHPYRSDLIGKDLSGYKDPKGKKIFIEAVKLVGQYGEGYIDYQWQWKDDPSRIVPKLSYVKSFGPWDWIIGTGIYLDDVQLEISSMKGKLFRISFGIILVIMVTISYVIRQSLKIEKQRLDTEEKLKQSKLKYKSLVEASTEGTLMMVNNVVIFANKKFRNLTGYNDEDISHLKFDEIFTLPFKGIIEKFEDPDKSVTLETSLITVDHGHRDVIISVSQVKQKAGNGFIVIVKDVTRGMVLEIENSQLTYELQAALLLMNQPVKKFVKEIFVRDANTSIAEVARSMKQKNVDLIFIGVNGMPVGVVNSTDINKRLVATGGNPNGPVSSVMTAPVISLNEDALLYEVIICCKNENISHVAIKNRNGKIIGSIGFRDILSIQYNSMGYTILEIEKTGNIEGIKKVYDRLPVLVNALVESGDKAQIVTRVITSVNDAVTRRVIELAIEKYGPPPCLFSFMVMGSEGRMEQTLKTDQDNAIIFDDKCNKLPEDIHIYFQRLGDYISNNLNLLGLTYCNGGIMASNPKWVRSLDGWKSYFKHWINNSNPRDILDSAIFFDFRNVYGTDDFTAELRGYVHKLTSENAVYLYHAAESVIKFKPPLNAFGNIIAEHDENDIKLISLKKLLLPVISFVRIYALKNQVKETNTLNRINELYKLKVINKSVYHNLMLSYNFLMVIRFRVQVKKILSNEQPVNEVELEQLSEIEKTTLKKVLSEISLLQGQLSFDFKGGT